MAERDELPRQMVRASACLQPDHRRLELAEERQHLVAPQLAAHHHLLVGVDAMQLEELLRRVGKNARNLSTDGSLRLKFSRPQSGTTMPLGGRPPHHERLC
jgi:hypothetical protein